MTADRKGEIRPSPKGLIEYHRRPLKPGGKGFEVRQVDDRTVEFHGPGAIDSLKATMEHLRDAAFAVIQGQGHDPKRWRALLHGSSATADRAYVAACMLSRLADVQRHFNDLCRSDGPDGDGARNAAMAITAALNAGANYYALGIVENERAIYAGGKSIAGQSEAAGKKRQNYSVWDVRLAEEYLRRRQRATESSSALKARIGSEQEPPLARSSAIDAINRGLKKLSG